MFDKKTPPKTYPCFLRFGNGESYTIASLDHYNYLNEKANKLYQTVYGYESQPDLDFYCSTHPQEANCFAVALIMDSWIDEHPFNS